MPIMVASIANFDSPRQFSSVKPPKSGVSISIKLPHRMPGHLNASNNVEFWAHLRRLILRYRAYNLGEILANPEINKPQLANLKIRNLN